MNAALAAEAEVVAKMRAERRLTREALYDARLEARIAGVPLIDALLARDVVSDAEVAQAYATRLGLRYLDLSRRRPSAVWARTIPENVARLKGFIPFGEVSGHLVISVADPGDAAVPAVLARYFDRPVQFVVSPRDQIEAAHQEIHGEARSRGARLTPVTAVATGQALQVSAAGMNVVEQLDSIIDEAVDRRASDIHIEPEDDRLRVRMRVDGRMVESRAYPLEAQAAMVSRVKVLANMDIVEKRKPQDGRFSHRSFEQDIDVRVACIPTVAGERVTLRLLAMDRSHMDLASLGMELETKQAFERLIRRPYGIILITGPTGSGKSTTMYAALQQINSIDKHIITIEDPVEYHIPSVNQVQVDAEYGVTFAGALRSIVRHDPDVIMVGEIRDEETAHLALEAALTGHLVFATLHTNSAVGALTRLLDMNCEPYLVSSAIVGVMAQRLVRRICEKCRKRLEPNSAERGLLGIPEGRVGATIYRGAGCARCTRSGYYDRIGIYEYVPFDQGLSEMVMNKASTEVMYRYAAEQGAVTLREDALAKVRRGLTTLEEALRVTASAF